MENGRAGLPKKNYFSALKEKMFTQLTLAIREGVLYFQENFRRGFSRAKHPRCWMHKTANVFEKISKSVSVRARSMIHEMYLYLVKEDSFRVFDDSI
jgi:putative transposase